MKTSAAKQSKMSIFKLLEEINKLVDTLVKVDTGTESPVRRLEQIEKVLALLPMAPTDIYFPIHTILACGPLIQTVLPRNILTALIESGFDVNVEDDLEMTCLNVAIKNAHYDAVRLLVQHGADVNIESHGYVTISGSEDHSTSPLALLASKPNVPLDLFDLLATPETFYNAPFWYSPLQIALSFGHQESALHLIKLGADVNMRDQQMQLPIETFWRWMNVVEFNDELFTRLIPSETRLQLFCIVSVLDDINHGMSCVRLGVDIRCKMLCLLLQYLGPPTGVIRISKFDLNSFATTIKLALNDRTMARYNETQLHVVYAWTLLFVHLEWNVADPASIATGILDFGLKNKLEPANKIGEIWRSYAEKSRSVKSLRMLCIQKTRCCMQDFSDESFKSLCLPKQLTQMLMYQDIADLICETMRG